MAITFLASPLGRAREGPTRPTNSKSTERRLAVKVVDLIGFPLVYFVMS